MVEKLTFIVVMGLIFLVLYFMSLPGLPPVYGKQSDETMRSHRMSHKIGWYGFMVYLIVFVGGYFLYNYL